MSDRKEAITVSLVVCGMLLVVAVAGTYTGVGMVHRTAV